MCHEGTIEKRLTKKYDYRRGHSMIYLYRYNPRFAVIDKVSGKRHGKESHERLAQMIEYNIREPSRYPQTRFAPRLNSPVIQLRG